MISRYDRAMHGFPEVGLTRRAAGKRIVAASAAAAAAPALLPPSPAMAHDVFVRASSTQAGTPTSPTPATIWELKPANPKHGPFNLVLSGSTFNSRFDPVISLGYNWRPSGAVKRGEPGAGWVIEADYDDGDKRTIEMYSSIFNAEGDLVVRPFFFQVKRDATTLDTFLTRASVIGNPFNVLWAGSMKDVQMLAVNRNIVTMYAPDQSAPTTLRIKAAAGRASQIMLGANGLDDALQLATNSANADLAQINLNSRPIVHMWSAPLGSAGSAISVGVADNQAVGVFDVGTSLPAVKALVARSRASQVGNIFEAQGPNAEPLSGFTANGYFFTRKTAAPADAELSAGEMALWFDASDRGPKLMVKGKQADGSVKTASLALS